MTDKICPKCEGAGLINYEHTCTVCNGEGVVSSDMMSRDQLVELDALNNIIVDLMADVVNSTAAPFQNAPPPGQRNFPSGLMKLREYQRALVRMIRPNGLRTTERIKSVYEEDDTHSR